MNNQFDEFLEEVQNDIKHEKYQRLWQQYGKQVTAGVTAVIAAVALYMLWSNYQERKQIEMSDKFISAMNFIAQGKDNEALALLGTISASDGKAYGFLKELQKAYILSKDPDGNVRTQATAVYEGMMGNSALPVIVKDLARLLAAKSHSVQKTKTADEIISLLEPLRGDKNPLHHMAREFIAEQLYFKGDKKAALELFAELARDPESPEGLKHRAQLMVQVANQGMPSSQEASAQPTSPSTETK